MPTRFTKELGLRATISFFGMSTSSAALAGIVGINLNIRHTVKRCFVLDKLSKLIEAPIASPRSGLAPNPGPQVDTRQFLDSHTLFCAFSAFTQFLGDAVVNILLEAS